VLIHLSDIAHIFVFQKQCCAERPEKGGNISIGRKENLITLAQRDILYNRRKQTISTGVLSGSSLTPLKETLRSIFAIIFSA
jgi:hypothetical protein